jgi:hypothetical protein
VRGSTRTCGTAAAAAASMVTYATAASSSIQQVPRYQEADRRKQGRVRTGSLHIA